MRAEEAKWISENKKDFHDQVNSILMSILFAASYTDETELTVKKPRGFSALALHFSKIYNYDIFYKGEDMVISWKDKKANL